MIVARFPVRAQEEETKYESEVKKTCSALKIMAIKLQNILSNTASRHAGETDQKTKCISDPMTAITVIINNKCFLIIFPFLQRLRDVLLVNVLS